jgi:hypothetical protein
LLEAVTDMRLSGRTVNKVLVAMLPRWEQLHAQPIPGQPEHSAILLKPISKLLQQDA